LLLLLLEHFAGRNRALCEAFCIQRTLDRHFPLPLPSGNCLRRDAKRARKGVLGPEMTHQPLEYVIHPRILNHRLKNCQPMVDRFQPTVKPMGISYKKETFAARLKKLWEAETDHSLEKLGQIAAGKGKDPVSPQGAHKWIKGTSIPTADKLRNIAKYYGVTREWLLFGDSPRRPLAMDIAHAADLLSSEDLNELARYAARLLDACKEVPMGVDHDRFAAQLKVLSSLLRNPH
jgi:transcriptional regulator with XRE-family HTH domain